MIITEHTTMAGDHEHDHHGHYHHGHDHHGHGHDDHGEMLVLSARKPSRIKKIAPDALFHVDGIETGSFAIANSKKQLRSLMRSAVDVVYDQKKGKLYLNSNGEAKGWGKRKVGGLIAKLKSKPSLTDEQFEGLDAFESDALTGLDPHHQNHGDHDNKAPDSEMETLFSTRSEARAAAKNFGCKGAHQHGEMWMPCNNMADMAMPTVDHSDHDHSGHDHSGHDHAGHGEDSHRIV